MKKKKEVKEVNEERRPKNRNHELLCVLENV